MAAKHQTSSPLFKLSPELRNLIYEQISITHPTNDEPSIFRTCRKIRTEGLKLFYATHAFRFTAETGHFQRWDATTYQHFLTCIGAEKATRIEHVRFELHDIGARTDGRNVVDGYIDVVVDAEKAEVLSAAFSTFEDVIKEDVEALEKARVALNNAWAAHSNPNKPGMLRTLAALVPIDVKVQERLEGQV